MQQKEAQMKAIISTDGKFVPELMPEYALLVSKDNTTEHNR